jgi:RNA polymerase sigma-70 factor (ECF subfamily)
MGTVATGQEIQQAASSYWTVRPDGAERTEAPVVDEFEHIYRMYGPRVRSLCLRMTGNRDEAEDLTQETFLRLLQKLDTFRGESAFYTWLRRVAVNVVLLRFQSASWRRETSLEELTELDPATGSPPKREFGREDTMLLGVVDRIDLQHAIGQLPPGFKAVFVLHDVEGFEHTEISKLMGCSIGTSKSQLHKARLKIRELVHETEREKARERRLAAAEKAPMPVAKEHIVLRFPPPLLQEYTAPTSEAA